MPRSMADPNYVYRPWTPERKQAASDREKARIAAKAGDVISGRDFVNQLREALSDLAAQHAYAEAMLCACGYMKLRFPEEAESIEQNYVALAKWLRWE